MDAMAPPAALVPTRATLAQWPVLIAHRVHVTPEMAAGWLATANTDNRQMRPASVRRYAEMMKNGDWKFTHQGVAFSHRRIIDGQHRLAAIVASNKPQWMVVFVEQEDDVFGVLDRGTARTLRDDLRYDVRITDAISWLARGIHPSEQRIAVPISEARRVADVFAPILAEMVEASGSVAKGRTAAAVRGAVALRLSNATGEAREYILSMWRAWTLLNFDDMAPSIKAGLKRLDGVNGGGSASQMERACVAWQAFDPAARDLSRILIRSSGAQMAEMRAALSVAMTQP
jgi:hypothetical protein